MVYWYILYSIVKRTTSAHKFWKKVVELLGKVGEKTVRYMLIFSFRGNESNMSNKYS